MIGSEFHKESKTEEVISNLFFNKNSYILDINWAAFDLVLRTNAPPFALSFSKILEIGTRSKKLGTLAWTSR